MHNPSRQGGCRLFLATCALVAPLFLASVPARAQQPAETQQPPAASEKLVNVDVREARLEQTITGLMSLNGLTNIVVRNEAGRNFGLVTVKLVDQPLRRVLQAIASSAGAVLEEQDGIYYLRHKNESDDALKPVTAPKPNPAEAVSVPAPKPRKPRQFARVPLNYLQASFFVKMLDDPEFLNLMESSVPSYDSPVKFGTAPPIIHQLGPNAPTSANTSPNYVPGNPENNTPPVSGVPGSTAGREGENAGRQGFGGGRGGLGGGQGGGGGFGGGQGGPGGFGGGQGGQGGQQGGQNSLRPQGITNIIASDTQNALIVEYDEVEDLNRLREIIRLLDVAPQQVIVRAEFVAVNVADADAFGVDWRLTPSANTDVAIPPESGTTPTVTIAYASGNAVANLRASIIRTTRNVLQAPIITTINNRPANIQFTDVVTIPQTTNIVGANGQIISGTTQIPVFAQNGLNVTPHINGDGTITMFLQPFLSTQNTTAAGGISQQFQTLTTTRRIRNGETMVLGGFITKSETRAVNKVPLLSDLPIIGNLFTQRTRNVVGSEVLVFITATVIDEGGQPVVGATQPSGPLP